MGKYSAEATDDRNSSSACGVWSSANLWGSIRKIKLGKRTRFRIIWRSLAKELYGIVIDCRIFHYR